MIAIDWILVVVNPQNKDIPELDQVKSGVLIAWVINTVLFVLVYVLILWRSIMRFFGDVFLLRKGFYQFNEHKNDSYSSVNYIAAYIGNAIFSYYFFFWMMTIIITPMCIPFVWRLAWHYRQYWLSTIAFVLINVIMDKALDCYFTDETHFKHRRQFQYYDLIRFGTGFLASVGSGIGRYIILFLMLIISLYRVDKQSIPRWVSQFFSKNMDLVNMKHNSFLKCFHCHNNPILHTFVLLVKGKTFKSKSDYKLRYTVMEHGLDRNNPKDAEKEKKTDAIEMEKVELKEDKPKHNRRHFQIRESFKLGEFPKIRNPRIAFKWQLMVLLAQNPSLLQFRKREKLEAADDLNEEEDSVNDNNINLMYEENPRNFYKKKGPERMTHLDDDNFEIKLKKKIKKKRNLKVDDSEKYKAKQKEKEKKKKAKNKKKKEKEEQAKKGRSRSAKRERSRKDDETAKKETHEKPRSKSRKRKTQTKTPKKDPRKSRSTREIRKTPNKSKKKNVKSLRKIPESKTEYNSAFSGSEDERSRSRRRNRRKMNR